MSGCREIRNDDKTFENAECLPAGEYPVGLRRIVGKLSAGQQRRGRPTIAIVSVRYTNLHGS